MLRFRATAVVAAAALLMAGCATGPGLAKTNSPRRTVQAGADASSTDPSVKPSAQPNKPVDPAFAAERLRLINPCALMEKDLLQTVGTPSKYSSSSYTRCSNYMKNKAGKTLNITLDIGYSLTSTEVKNATKQIAGLKSGEQKLSNTSCFVTAVTQENPPQAARIQVSTGNDGGEACEPGRKVLEGAVRKLKGNPQKYSPPKGSPVEVDPCTIVEKAALAPVLGASPRSLPYGLHQCSWSGQSSQLQLEFKTTRIPKDGKFDSKSVEVDLGGGVKGYQAFKDGSFPTCELVVVRTKDSSDAGEIAEFIAAGSKEKEFDRCQAAQTFAKAVLPSLPAA
ncbi:hypothetical protein FXN61_30015 [Lentzea sp. PSKA42]|uniref:DUF3558 domain-containing protein n=1 Tax=Lentzea indica TaxID=2604800 RepID=A0ABX1FPS8_9PSEU|nr:hypothetical protein [Lentzea indica]NKE60792.1 hypothetical protein [Lentzea indica]